MLINFTFAVKFQHFDWFQILSSNFNLFYRFLLQHIDRFVSLHSNFNILIDLTYCTLKCQHFDRFPILSLNFNIHADSYILTQIAFFVQHDIWFQIVTFYRFDICTEISTFPSIQNCVLKFQPFNRFILHHYSIATFNLLHWNINTEVNIQFCPLFSKF